MGSQLKVPLLIGFIWFLLIHHFVLLSCKVGSLELNSARSGHSHGVYVEGQACDVVVNRDLQLSVVGHKVLIGEGPYHLWIVFYVKLDGYVSLVNGNERDIN